MDDEPRAERLLVDRARQGDADAWELLYRRAYPRLIAYARRRLATPEQAEEAVSETMVRAMDSIEHYRPSSGIERWLFGIARNVVLEAYRSGARERPATPERFGNETASGPGQGDPEHAVLATEERRLLATAFERLSPQDQEILELRVLGGLDAARVGELTGRRAGAVRTAQSRALARLRVGFEGLMA